MTEATETPSDGIYYDVDYDIYDKWQAINNSALKWGSISTAHMLAYICGRISKHSDVLNLGRLVHVAVLEPHLIDQFQVWEKRRAGTEWESFNADYGVDNIVKPEDMIVALSVKKSIEQHREAARIICECKKEVSIIWTDKMYGRGKARIDLLQQNGCEFGDLKTTSRVDPHKFRRQFFSHDLSYYMQFGWIWEGLDHLLKPTTTTAYVVSAETKPIYDVAVYEVSDDALHIGRKHAVKIARQYHIAKQTDSFNGVSGGEVLMMDAPQWMKDKEAAESLIWGQE